MTENRRNAEPLPWQVRLDRTRAQYEICLGWPTVVDLKQRRLIVPVGTVVDGLIMPAAIGRPVLHVLQASDLRPPVISGPGGTWWTFVTLPVRVRPAVLSSLAANGIRLVPRGAHIVLPESFKARSPWAWVTPCLRRPSLPSVYAIIRAARETLSLEGSLGLPTRK